MRAVLSIGLAIGVILIAGCGDDEVTRPVPIPLPENTSPAATMSRFIALYEQKNATEYTRLFTGDFRFEFSVSADPDLANGYAAGWFKNDEEIAATNLFEGGLNKEGTLLPGARTIELSFAGGAPVGDTLSGRDTTLYKMLLTPITLTIQLFPDENDPEGTTFVVGEAEPAVHRFFLVRGDVANGLGADQVADSTRWYIWFWRDETASVGLPNTTWGRVKDLYR